MAKRNLAATIAEKFLEPPYLEVTQRMIEGLMTAATEEQPANLDRIESIGMVRRELRKLAEKEGGAS